MKRLTTDTPNGNFETALNFVFSHDGWAYIRAVGELENVPLHDWAKAQCIKHGCEEFPYTTAEDIDEVISDCIMDGGECPVAMAYCFACQAVHLRDRLMRYEDTGYMPTDIKDMHNELCLKCGKYEDAHNGACDGCRWRKEDTE